MDPGTCPNDAMKDLLTQLLEAQSARLWEREPSRSLYPMLWLWQDKPKTPSFCPESAFNRIIWESQGRAHSRVGLRQTLGALLEALRQLNILLWLLLLKILGASIDLRQKGGFIFNLTLPCAPICDDMMEHTSLEGATPLDCALAPPFAAFPLPPS